MKQSAASCLLTLLPSLNLSSDTSAVLWVESLSEVISASTVSMQKIWEAEKTLDGSQLCFSGGEIYISFFYSFPSQLCFSGGEM